MVPHWRNNYIIRLLLDFMSLGIAFLIVRFYIIGKSDLPLLSNAEIKLFFVSCLIWYFSAKTTDLYDDFRSRSFAYEIIPISKVIIIHSVLITVFVFYYYNADKFPRTFISLYTLLVLVIIPIQKFAQRRVRRNALRKGFNSRNVLVIGAGEVGLNFYKMVNDYPHYGYRVAGFLDDEVKSSLNGLYLGSLTNIQQVLDKHLIDDVVVALPNDASYALETVVEVSEKNTKRVRIIPDYYRFGSGNFRLSNFGTFPMITVRSLPLDDLENQFFKRFFDIFCSIIAFIFIFSWLFPLIALIIKLTSKGPVFFIQERWGINNQKIRCFKFRSMYATSADIDSNGKYQQATKNDKRITKIGKILRKTNLDEFPQFWNVLLGNMSIVGPRPHPIPLNIESKDSVTNYMLRHLVKPGITGWAQVNGCRGETNVPGQMQKRVDLDIWYIENWSFWLDCQIMFQTVMNMFIGDKNAY
jgi:putative colanic acid biosynthesis UDP-glucose lipid carrier transferase